MTERPFVFIGESIMEQRPYWYWCWITKAQRRRLFRRRHMRREIRLNPYGYVAQRMIPEDSGARGPWLLTYLREPGGEVAMEIFTDDEVKDWPVLVEADQWE